jgi:hypothetical protein
MTATRRLPETAAEEMQQFFARQEDSTLSLMLKLSTLYKQPQEQKHEKAKHEENEETSQKERQRSKTL